MNLYSYPASYLLVCAALKSSKTCTIGVHKTCKVQGGSASLRMTSMYKHGRK